MGTTSICRESPVRTSYTTPMVGTRSARAAFSGAGRLRAGSPMARRWSYRAASMLSTMVPVASSMARGTMDSANRASTCSGESRSSRAMNPATASTFSRRSIRALRS